MVRQWPKILQRWHWPEQSPRRALRPPHCCSTDSRRARRVGAAPFSVTVQESAPDADIVALLHDIALNAAAAEPVPLRLIRALGLLEELLEIVTPPVNELA